MRKPTELFERVQSEFPNDEIARDALSQTASAYSRPTNLPRQLSLYQKYIEKYPNADNLERAYLNIVDILRDQGKDSEALKWTAKTQNDFKGKLPEAIALFAQARIHICAKKLDKRAFGFEHFADVSRFGRHKSSRRHE